MGGDLNTNSHAMHVAGQWETCGMHRGGPLLGHDFESAWGKHPGARESLSSTSREKGTMRDGGWWGTCLDGGTKSLGQCGHAGCDGAALRDHGTAVQ